LRGNIIARGDGRSPEWQGSGHAGRSLRADWTVLMPGRGFSVTVVPKNGRPARHYEVGVSGVVLLWAGIAVLLVLAAAGVVMSFAGSPFDPFASKSAARIAQLEDSLEMLTDLDRRMDSLEVRLAELCEARERLERIAGFAGPLPGDTL